MDMLLVLRRFIGDCGGRSARVFRLHYDVPDNYYLLAEERVLLEKEKGEIEANLISRIRSGICRDSSSLRNPRGNNWHTKHANRSKCK